MSETAVLDTPTDIDVPQVVLPEAKQPDPALRNEQVGTPEQAVKVSRLARMFGKSALNGAEVQTTKEASADNRLRRLGRGMLMAAQVEGVGLAVDGTLIALGVNNIVKREAIASIGDAVSFKVFGHEGHASQVTAEPISRLKKAGTLAKDLAIGATVAVTSAKTGIEAASIISPGVHEGVAGAAVVMGSKLAGLNAYSAVKSRMENRRQASVQAPQEFAHV